MEKILQKIYNIQKSIDTMPKDGYNDFNRYNYLMEAQVTTKIKELMDREKVVFHYQSEVTETKEYQGAKGDTQFLVTVKIPYAFYDVESGEKLDGVVYGQGADKGDKGVYKAITGAIKYLYMKTFNIPTGNDPEKDSPELKPKYQPTGTTTTMEKRKVIPQPVNLTADEKSALPW